MCITVLLLCLLVSCSHENVNHNYYKCVSYTSINDFFQKQEGILISGHRGGNLPGYPENCIETFDKILESLPTVFEIDPRMTKDSVVVLMHDKSLDRTTTGSGLVKDYTYEELQQFNLKDRWGNITEYKIPSVKDVIMWSKDKVILNFDIKDVTRDVLVPLVQSLDAVNCMFTVRNTEEALEVYNLNPEARMSAWIRSIDEFYEYNSCGIPWQNIPMVYVVSDVMNKENNALYSILRSKGVKCMVSTAPVQDKIQIQEDRLAAFKDVLKTSPDVIESDFPTEFVSIL